MPPGSNSDFQAGASLQLSIYSYATAMNGLADEQDLRLRFDVLTKTKQPELHRYWTIRDRERTSGSTAWPRRSSPPSRRACSPACGLALPGLLGAEPVLGVGVTHASTAPIAPRSNERALAPDLPVLAILPGVQVLNVGLDGTFCRDLPTDRPGRPHARPDPRDASRDTPSRHRFERFVAAAPKRGARR